MNTPPGWQAAVIRGFGREEVAAETGPGILTDGQQLEGEAPRLFRVLIIPSTRFL